jgi:hypothetical protein
MPNGPNNQAAILESKMTIKNPKNLDYKTLKDQ